MNICIIDDEHDNREILSYIIKNQKGDYNIVGEASNVQDCIELIMKTKPDLIFLDIEMPDGSGFDLLYGLGEYKPEIIFCTAYNQFALKAIECSALAYILKPLTTEMVTEALQKAIVQLDKNQKALQYDTLYEQLNHPKSNPVKFLVKNTEGLHIVYYEELIYCVADSNYTYLFIENKKKITVSKTLKEIEKILESNSNFMRIHQSFIINLEKIKNISRIDAHLAVVMSDGKELFVSRSKRDEFMVRIGE
jgi:two-component system LytT family response regulator